VESVLKEIEKYWPHFLESDLAKGYRDEVEKFRAWLKTVGVRLFSLRAREAAERGNPVARDYPEEYIKGLVRRGGARVLVNLFAAYLVQAKVVSQYYLIKNKYVAGGESIATWIRLLKKDKVKNT